MPMAIDKDICTFCCQPLINPPRRCIFHTRRSGASGLSGVSGGAPPTVGPAAPGGAVWSESSRGGSGGEETSHLSSPGLGVNQSCRAD